ncbi:MAG: hypothetical protein V4581_09945 [Bacteroidota bacterium]
MIAIKKETDIEASNVIYNPAENVRYTVDSYDYDSEWKTEVAHLKPQLPLGMAKKAFSMTIENMVKQGYKLEK